MIRKAKKLLTIFFLAVSGIFLLPQPAQAGWVRDIILGIPARLSILIVWAITKFAIWYAGWTGSVLNWVLSPDFTNLSYTNPAQNPVIEIGLSVTRGFVNMLLVLILVYIAIATILRLAGYETKKLLFTFFIVALLVNFSPLICGIIVDASNIVMNFFIQDLKSDVFAMVMGNRVDQILAGFEWMSIDFDSALKVLNQLVIMTGFLFTLSSLFFIFIFIFAIRYIVIWIMVILSPLAFACYILPATKKYFEKWWQQFVSWSFIGATAGFFLYLGMLFIANIPSSINTPHIEEDPFFNNILPFFVSIIFLGAGAVFGIKTSAMGASSVINFVKTTDKKVTKKVARATGRGIKQQVESKLRTKEAAGRIVKTAEKWGKYVPMSRWFIPETLRKYAEFRPSVDKEQERTKPYSSREIAHRIVNRADIGQSALGGIMEMANRGDMQDLINAYKEKYKKKTGKKTFTEKDLFENKGFNKEMERTIEMSFGAGYQSKLLRGEPRLARIAAGKKWAFGYTDLSPEKAVKKATREVRRPQINNWEKEVLLDDTVVSTLMEKGREVFEAVDAQVKLGQETALETIDKLFSEYIDNILSKESPDIAKDAKTGTPQATEKAWEKFQNYFKENHKNREGYFLALESERFKDRGWRKGQYLSPEKRKKEKEETSTPTPGEATIGTPPKSKDREANKEKPPKGRQANKERPPKGRRANK